LEDRCLATALRTAGGLNLTLGLVADGVGGEQAGERAAELTVQTILATCRESVTLDVPRLLTQAIEAANARVYHEGRRVQQRSGMASTIAIAAILNGRLFVASAGDSRVFLVRAGKAIRLTRDHTWGEEAQGAGKITPEEASRHPRRDDLLRSIGFEPAIEADVSLWLESSSRKMATEQGRAGILLLPGDAILVTSDGLTKSQPSSRARHFVEELEFPGLLRARDSRAGAQALVSRAVERGTDDNVSVVVLRPGRRPSALSALRRVPTASVWVLACTALLGMLLIGAGWMQRHAAGDEELGPPEGMALVTALDGVAELRLGDSPWAPASLQSLLSAQSGAALRTGPESAFIALELADRSEAILGPDTEAHLLAIGGEGSTSAWELLRGVLLVSTPDDMGVTVTVHGSRGASARVLGSLMGVWIDAGNGGLHVDCFHSRCAAVGGPPMRQSILLRSGEHAVFDIDGSLVGPSPLRYEIYRFAPGWVASPTAPPGNVTPGLRAASATPLGALFLAPTATPPLPKPGDGSGRHMPTSTPTDPPTSTPPPTIPPPDPPTETEPPPPTEEPPPTDEPPTEEPPEPTPESATVLSVLPDS
jgi:protein phosphatase